MNITIEPGKYVVAVSGGVDSTALLHMLQDVPGMKLIVAHYDHGIREDSRSDRLFVQDLAKNYGLPFVYDQGELGPRASEAAARKARYNFLYKVRLSSGARSIITAHHQDDALETAIINILRGSGRKGLSSLNSRHGLERPLLHVPKSDIIAYAREQGLAWREDSTNKDQRHLRNHIRYQIMPRFDEKSRAQLWGIIKDSHVTNQELDTLLINQLHFQPRTGSLDRYWFNQLPHDVATEVMAAWLRAHGVRSFDSKGLERLVIAAKIAQPGSQFDVLQSVTMQAEKDNLALNGTER